MLQPELGEKYSWKGVRERKQIRWTLRNWLKLAEASRQADQPLGDVEKAIPVPRRHAAVW